MPRDPKGYRGIIRELYKAPLRDCMSWRQNYLSVVMVEII